MQQQDNLSTYILGVEQQNAKLQEMIDKYLLLIGASYHIYVVDPSINKLNFSLVMNYYINNGWILNPKKFVAENKRRWEYFTLPSKLQQCLRSPKSKKEQVYKFPYKSKSHTLEAKYKIEHTEAINRFNEMLNVQAVIENKLPLEIYDYWVKNFSY